MPVIKGFTAPGLPGEDEERREKRSGVIEGFTPYSAPDIPTPNTSRTRNPLEFANDTVVRTVNSGAGLIKGISDFVSVDNPVSQGLQRFIDMGEETYSDNVKQDRAALEKALDGSMGEAALGIGKYVLTSPVQTAAEIVGNIGPIGRAIKATTGVANAAKLGQKAVTRVGTATGAGLGGAAAGGDAAESAYRQVMANENIPIEHRESLAREAARLASVPAFGLGALSGGTGLERVMAGGKGLGRQSIRRVAGKEFAGEFGEEAGTALSGNAAAALYGSNDDVMKGVFGQGLYGGVLGAGGAAGHTFLHNRAIQAELLATANPSVDQSAPASTPTLGLEYNPDAGNYIVYPDGSIRLGSEPMTVHPNGDVTMNEDQEFQRRSGTVPAPSVIHPVTGEEIKADDPRYADVVKAKGSAASPAAQDQIANDEPTNEAAKTGLFTEDEQKLIEMGVRPTKKSLELLQEIKGAGLSDDALVPVVTAMAQNKWGQAKKLLAAALVDKQKAATVAPVTTPETTNVSTTVPAGAGLAASVGTGTADVQGSVGATGSVPDVATAVGGNPGGVVSGSPEAPVLSSAPTEPAAPVERVVRRKKKIEFASPQQGAAFVAPEVATDVSTAQPAVTGGTELSAEDQLAIAQATGDMSGLQAVAEEEAGLRADNELAGDDRAVAQAVDAILEKRFGTTEKGKRQAEIAKAYLTAMRAAPKGSKVKVQEIIAEKFGIKPVTVRKYGNTTELVEAGKALGYTEAQVRDLLEVNDNSKAAAGEAVEATESSPDIAGALQQVGVETAEGETAGFGDDASRTWKQARKGMGDTTNETDELKANAITSLLDQKEKLEETIQQYIEEGNTDLAEKLQEQLAKFDALIEAATSDYAKYLADKQGKKDTSGGEKKETPKKATVRKAKADVPAEAPAQAKTTAEQYTELTNGYPVPAFDELTAKQQDRIRDLANRGELNLAAINSVLGEIRQSRRPGVSAVDQDGTRFDAEETTLEDLADNPGIRKAIAVLNQAGLGHAFLAVKRWYVTDSPVGWDAIYTVMDGEPSVVVSTEVLQSPADAFIAVTHELGHAVEELENGGMFSGDPEMNLRIVNGEVVAMNPDSVIGELLDHISNNDDALTELMRYPLDRTDSDNAALSANRTREEVFAQLFAFASGEGGRAFLRENLPRTAAFMEKVHAEIKATTYEAGAKQGRQSGQVQGRPQDATAARPSRQASAQGAAGLNAFGAASSKLSELLKNPAHALSKIKLGFLTLEQMAEMKLPRTDLIKAYGAVMDSMQKVSKDMVARAANIDRDWARLDPANDSKLSKVMRTATRMQFDPDKDTARTQEQTDLARDFNAMPDLAKKIYRSVRDHYETNFKERKAVLEDVATKLGGKALADVQQMYSQIKGPYFPLARTGDFYSVGMSNRVAELMDKQESDSLTPDETKELARLRKDRAHYIVRAHRTAAEAQKSSSQLRAQLGNSFYNEKAERISEGVSALPDFAKLEAHITTNMDADTRAQVKGLLTQFLFDSLPEHHALKNTMRREGIYGESEDMRRVFAQTAISQAHYISRLKYGQQLSKAMQDIRQAARRDIEMRTVENELVKRAQLAMNRSESRFADLLVNASYFAHLGLSPAFLLTNATQVPMITGPWLGARHGVAATKTALAVALKDAASIIKTSYANGGWRTDIDWKSRFGQNSDEARMLQDLLDANKLDITVEHDLAAIAKMQRGMLDDKVASATGNRLQGVSDVVQLVNTPVRVGEVANRLVTALAAYRLKRAELKGKVSAAEAHAQATAYAGKAVSQTQLNYSELNAPRYMRTVLGSQSLARMIFQFRKYQQGMLWLVMKNISDALPNSKATKEERRIARRTLTGLYATTWMLAGTSGMPLMGTIGVAGLANLTMMLAKALGMADDDDEPWDFETELRNYLTDWVGPELATLIVKGIPAYLGADISQRVGMGELANPAPFMRTGKTGQETLGNVMTSVAGAPFSFVGTALDGIMDMARGDTAKGFEKVMPVKGVKDVLKAYRYSDEGLTDKRGNVILPPEKFDAMDITLRGMGIAPTVESNYYDANEAVQNAKESVMTKRERLLRKYSEARVRDADTSDLEEKIKEFNDRHPERGIRIDASSKLKAVQQRRRLAENRTDSGVRNDRQIKPFADRGRFANYAQD